MYTVFRFGPNKRQQIKALPSDSVSRCQMNRCRLLLYNIMCFDGGQALVGGNNVIQYLYAIYIDTYRYMIYMARERERESYYHINSVYRGNYYYERGEGTTVMGTFSAVR